MNRREFLKSDKLTPGVIRRAFERLKTHRPLIIGSDGQIVPKRPVRGGAVFINTHDLLGGAKIKGVPLPDKPIKIYETITQEGSDVDTTDNIDS